MAIYSTTFSQIQTATETACNRSLGYAFPAIFGTACAWLSSQFRHPRMLTSTTQTGSAFPYTLPDPYLEIKSIVFTRGTTVKELRQVSYVDVKSTQAVDSGVPGLYAIENNKVHIAPTPASTDSIEIIYYARPDEDITGSQTNVYTTYFPRLLTYACIVEAYGVVQDEERINMWEARRDKALAEANQAAWDAKAGPAMYLRNT